MAYYYWLSAIDIHDGGGIKRLLLKHKNSLHVVSFSSSPCWQSTTPLHFHDNGIHSLLCSQLNWFSLHLSKLKNPQIHELFYFFVNIFCILITNNICFNYCHGNRTYIFFYKIIRDPLRWYELRKLFYATWFIFGNKHIHLCN